MALLSRNNNKLLLFSYIGAFRERIGKDICIFFKYWNFFSNSNYKKHTTFSDCCTNIKIENVVFPSSSIRWKRAPQGETKGFCGYKNTSCMVLFDQNPVLSGMQKNHPPGWFFNRNNKTKKRKLTKYRITSWLIRLERHIRSKSIKRIAFKNKRRWR